MAVAQRSDVLIMESTKEIADILRGRTWDIVLELMLGELSEDELINRLDIAPMKLKLYLGRLESCGVIEKSQELVYKRSIKNVYRLKNKNLEVVLSSNNNLELERQLEFNRNKFHEFMRNGFKSLYQNQGLPNKQGAIFIKSSPERMIEFKNKLNLLIEDFKSEDNEAEQMFYLFMPMLFPYGNESELNKDGDEINEKAAAK